MICMLKVILLVAQNICMRVSKQLLVWSQEHIYWIASRFLILGFELDLYSPSEYCMVYWYMHIVFIKLIEKMQLRILASNENSKLLFLFSFMQILNIRCACRFLKSSRVVKMTNHSECLIRHINTLIVLVTCFHLTCSCYSPFRIHLENK